MSVHDSGAGHPSSDVITAVIVTVDVSFSLSQTIPIPGLVRKWPTIYRTTQARNHVRTEVRTLLTLVMTVYIRTHIYACL